MFSTNLQFREPSRPTRIGYALFDRYAVEKASKARDMLDQPKSQIFDPIDWDPTELGCILTSIHGKFHGFFEELPLLGISCAEVTIPGLRVIVALRIVD